MNRRQFLKLSTLIPAGLHPSLNQPQYTFGGWLLPASDCSPLVCDITCLQFIIMTGSKADRDAFLNAAGDYKQYRGRGWHIFSYNRPMTNREIRSLRELYQKEDCGYRLRFPAIFKESSNAPNR